MNNKLYIIGVGPGHIDYLTVKGYQILQSIPCIMGAKRLLEQFTDLPGKLIPVSAYSEVAQKEINEQLLLSDVAVIVSGNPNFFSLGLKVQQEFINSGVDYEMIPAISSVHLACARLCVDNSYMQTFSAHGRLPETTIEEYSKMNSFSILCGTRIGQDYCADIYEKLKNKFNAVACIDLSLEDEQLLSLDSTNLKELDVYSRLLVVFTTKGDN